MCLKLSDNDRSNSFSKFKEAILNGKTIIILSDRGVNKENLAVPALLATAGLHHHLLAAVVGGANFGLRAAKMDSPDLVTASRPSWA